MLPLAAREELRTASSRLGCSWSYSRASSSNSLSLWPVLLSIALLLRSSFIFVFHRASFGPTSRFHARFFHMAYAAALVALALSVCPACFGHMSGRAAYLTYFALVAALLPFFLCFAVFSILSYSGSSSWRRAVC